MGSGVVTGDPIAGQSRKAAKRPEAVGQGPEPGEIWWIGDIRFDPVSRQLIEGETNTRLSIKSTQVLRCLFEQAGEVVSREDLIDVVWDGNPYTGPRGLTYNIWLLRRALDPGASDEESDQEPPGSSAIETISRFGYRLQAPVRIERRERRRRPIVQTSPESDATVPAETASDAPGPRLDLRKGLAATTGLLMIAIAATALWLHLHRQRNASQTPLTQLDGAEEFPAYSPDHARLAYVWTRAKVPDRIRITSIDEPQQAISEISDGEAALNRPVWIDNDRLAYVRVSGDGSCEVRTVNLSTLERKNIATCHSESGVTLMDVSPDGKWLAIARDLPRSASVGIVLHRLADGEERVLTRPPATNGDNEIAWSPDGRRIAFIRGNDIVGDVFTVDVTTGKQTRLTFNAEPAYGITWSRDGRQILYFGQVKGVSGVWSVDPRNSERHLLARIDDGRSLTTVPDGSGDVVLSVHRFDEHVELFNLKDGSMQGSIASSGRDLYARACPDAEHVVLISMRSGTPQIWRANPATGESAPLKLPPGTPSPADCAPGSSRYAATIEPTTGESSQLIIGDLASNSLPPFRFSDGHHDEQLAWDRDGRQLILQSNRGSDLGVDLWTFDPVTHGFQQLTHDHGFFGNEVDINGQRWLYYSRDGISGLWRKPLAPSAADQPSQQVLQDLSIEDFANWQWYDGALWYLRREKQADELVRRDLQGNETVALQFPPRTVRRFRSLSIAPDGTALITMTGERQADLVRLHAG